MLPRPLIARAYLARSARLWLGLRLLLAGVLAVTASDPIRLSAAAIIPIVLLTVLVAFIDTARRRERELLGNLGIATVVVGALFAVPPLLAEILVRLLFPR